MIEIEFMTGNERHVPLPGFAVAAGLTHRFTVLQENTFPVRVPDTTFDEAVWRALLAFIIGFDPNAHVSIAEVEKDVLVNERPLAIYMDKWATLDDDRDPPEVVTLRTASGLRLCMLTEYYYLGGGPYPYGDACVYSLFSDREIDEEVMEFMRDRADASRWRFSETVLNAENIPAPDHLPRTRTVTLWGSVSIALVIAAALYFLNYGDRLSNVEIVRISGTSSSEPISANEPVTVI